MSALGAARAEVAETVERRDAAAVQLDASHTAYTQARAIYERDQMAVDGLNSRIDDLTKVIRLLEGMQG